MVKVGEYSAPDADAQRCSELRRLFGHVNGTADVAKVLKNEKRTVADQVERVEGGHLAEQDVLLSRTSRNKENPTQEVPYFVRDEYQIRTRGLLSFLRGIGVRCRNARSSTARGLLRLVLALSMTERQARSLRFACAAR